MEPLCFERMANANYYESILVAIDLIEQHGSELSQENVDAIYKAC